MRDDKTSVVKEFLLYEAYYIYKCLDIRIACFGM